MRQIIWPLLAITYTVISMQPTSQDPQTSNHEGAPLSSYDLWSVDNLSQALQNGKDPRKLDDTYVVNNDAWFSCEPYSLSDTTTPLTYLETPLQCAAYHSKNNVNELTSPNNTIDKLLLHNIDIMQSNQINDSPLHIAAKVASRFGIKRLLAFGSSLNACNNNNKTPDACITSPAFNIQYDPQNGFMYDVDEHIPTRLKTFMHQAIKGNYNEIINTPSEGQVHFDLNVFPRELGEISLGHSKFDTFEHILYDLELASPHNKNSIEMLAKLWLHATRLRYRGHSSPQTLLRYMRHIEQIIDEEEIIHVLCQSTPEDQFIAAKINSRPSKSCMAVKNGRLHQAVKKNEMQTIMEFLDNKDITTRARDKDGKSLLHTAIENLSEQNSKEMIQFLKDLGVSPYERDKEGRFPYLRIS